MKTKQPKSAKPDFHYPGMVTALKISPEQYDSLHSSWVMKYDDGRIIWMGQVTRFLASRFAIEVTPAVQAHIELLHLTRRSRQLVGLLADNGYRFSPFIDSEA
jgi:hypothetical protein